MPQALSPLAATWFATGVGAVVASAIKGQLLNLALGALEFRDENGDLWVAVDE